MNGISRQLSGPSGCAARKPKPTTADHSELHGSFSPQPSSGKNQDNPRTTCDAHELCPEDAYRLLLAINRRAPPDILVADRETVSRYRGKDMDLGFPEVAELLAKRGIWA